MEVSSRRRCLWQPWLSFDNLRTTCKSREERPKVTSLHRKPSSAWRKERRRDPIQSEALDMSAARVHHHNRPSVIVPTTPQPGTTIEDTAVTPTATATASAATAGQRTGMRSTGVVSDPAIDEHFKRSLGLAEYAAVFNASSSTDKETGLSVDDHFAKALGETWTRLQATNRTKDST
ncbi:transcription cofactor vestigial-like protein 4 isoform X2 [Cephus cinctus]|uniref:Transcription cofactor vestigial-like protein 4 isoform X2 n=1 Tax=Cephus cinctus TaxID=211228 RepID=A0AAJ7C7F1_CEPCN|nr:transcription cofactor vestigial-like protein 4 isoform X2 [Cephus cinctus]